MSQVRAYLDYNATAPLRAGVMEAVAEALALGGNPSSVHSAGRAARRLVERARGQVAALAGAVPAQLIFTSGGTEANNLAIARMPARSLIASAVEHDSVRAAVRADGEAGRPVSTLPVDADGVTDLNALARLLDEAPAPALVCLMLANNETGVIQPVAEAAEMVHAKGGLIHCDAIQALGKIDVDAAALDADSLSLSGHKIGAPAGVGALVLREGLGLKPLIVGGGQELSRRSGTENLAGIAGFGRAAEIAGAKIGEMLMVKALRDGFERRLKAMAPDAVIHGAGAARLANTSNVAMPGVSAETQVMALDLEGVCVSSGSACSSGKVKPSHVLAAMGLSEAEASYAIRVSFGWESGEADVERLLAAWKALYDRTAKRRAAA